MRLPLSGDQLLNTTTDSDIECGNQRFVRDQCVICISSFQIKDRVTWSSNLDCEHVFHETCILQWLKASGQQRLTRSRLRRDYQLTPIRLRPEVFAEVTTGPWLCPICRLDFILPSDDCNCKEDDIPQT